MGKKGKMPDMNLMKGGYIDFLKEYTARKKKEVAQHGEEPENA